MSPSKKNTQEQAAPEAKTGLSLADLKPNKGAVKNKLRVGRGRASGAGKTANRGHNGEGQRSGRSNKRGFEGGQMPLYRRLPHIDGFELINRRKWLELNVQDLDDLLLPGDTELTYEKLETLGVFKSHRFDGIRILGSGDIKKKMTVEAHHVTPAAREKIEAAGGQIRLMGVQE